VQLPPHKTLFPLLRRLADGRFHSGEALATEFGMSRANICNVLAHAETLGIALHAVRGRGYRLPTAIEWLDAGAIATHLGSLREAFDVRVLDSVDSTNRALLAAAQQGAASGTLVCAEHQQQGRGRRGRPWHSVPGGSLTFSLLWRYDTGLQSLAGLSLAAGLAVARAVNRHSAHPVGLKWPNDVVVGPRKLAGILVEVQGDLDGTAFAVVGIGVNVRLGEAQREGIDQAVVDLAELGVTVGRNRLLAECLAELHAVGEQFRAHGFAALREAWQELDVYAERPVVLTMPDSRTLRGVAAGVDDTGALRLRGEDGAEPVTLSGGEMSLRVGVGR
jgi:BirA family biotin operon repressor/biotin-[acetyl-CoA-carboxylase] ligase